MRAVLVIAAKDLRQRLRDRSFFILGIAAPFALALIFSFLLAPVTDGTFRPALGLADADGSEISAGLGEVLAGLDSEGVIRLSAGLDPDEAERLVADGELAAAIVVPSGFGQAVLAGEGATLEVVGSVDAPTSTLIARAITEGFAQRVQTGRLAVAAAAALGAGVDPAVGERAAAAEPPIQLGQTEAATRELDPGSYYTAGMAVFFVFFTVQFGVTSLLDERRDGTLARLLAAPIRRSQVVAAKLVTSVVLGVVSLVVLAVASQLLLGADWGDPVGVGVMILAVVASAVGLVVLVAGIARTPEGAGNAQAIAAVTLGALGGAFFQTSLGDGLLSRLALLTPHHWFLRGLADLVGGVPVTEVLPAAGAMVAFGVVTAAVGWPMLRRRVEA